VCMAGDVDCQHGGTVVVGQELPHSTWRDGQRGGMQLCESWGRMKKKKNCKQTPNTKHQTKVTGVFSLVML
jgi:hypothetical protein